MKRIMAVLLLLCLCPLCALAETTPGLDDQAIAELNHTIYKANQLEEIFSRHQSVTFSFNHSHEHDLNEVVWETAERSFRSWENNSMEYETTDVCYRLEYTDETDSADLYCVCVYGDPYFYCFVGEPEENFYNAEHENMTDCYEKDGLLFLNSEYDETLSRKAIENEGLEYKGETVGSRLIVDAKTYDIAGYCQYVMEDGNEREILSTNVAYDEPEPLASLALQAAFEHSSSNMMNVTYVFDKGTDHEITRTLTVPANSDCRIPVLDVPCVYFYDSDYSTLYAWDRMSDHTIYFVTNPSEELIERFEQAYDAATSPSDSTDSGNP